MVTRKKKPRLNEEQKRRKKKKPKELENFYRFQMREDKRNRKWRQTRREETHGPHTWPVFCRTDGAAGEV